MEAETTIEAVLKQCTEELMGLPGVVGTGEGRRDGKPCVAVFVTRKTPTVVVRIPSELGGYPVEVEKTGEFGALGSL